MKTKLILDSVDAWLLTQPTLINKRAKSVLPAARDRQTLVSTLRGLLGDLGLKRRAKALPSLGDYLRGREATGTADGNGAQSDERQDRRTRGINRAANAAGNRGGAMRQARTTVTPSNRTDTTDTGSHARLITLAERLGPDEVAVLALIAERLLQGRRRYGDLHLASDRRDFQHEALEEAADLAVYAAAGLLTEKQEKREKSPP